MLKSEIEANEEINKIGYTDPFLRNQAYKTLLHYLRLFNGEYPRLPRKFKKKYPVYANTIKARKRSVLNG
jgi:hypothetical protein